MIDWIDPLKLICKIAWHIIPGILSCALLVGCLGFLSNDGDDDFKFWCFMITVVSVIALIIWGIIQAFLIYNPLF
jgi:L-asparagine transporter-like permease